jgi:hypothetical protein
MTNTNLLLALAAPGGGLLVCFDHPKTFARMCAALPWRLAKSCNADL